jgi:hypothetical protein
MYGDTFLDGDLGLGALGLDVLPAIVDTGMLLAHLEDLLILTCFTGSTLIIIPQAAYEEFLDASGGETDHATKFVRFTTKPTRNFSLTVERTTFALTPDQYLVPRFECVESIALSVYCHVDLCSQVCRPWAIR